MLNFKEELENDIDNSGDIDVMFYKLKYPKLKHFDISMSITQLFQPIKYNDEKDVTFYFHKGHCKNCKSFVLDVSMFNEYCLDYMLNHDRIIRYMIYNNLEFTRDFYYEGITRLSENNFNINFGT